MPSCYPAQRSSARYRDLLRSGDDTVRFICLVGEERLLRARLETRGGHFMPASLLQSQLAALELPDGRRTGVDIRRRCDAGTDRIGDCRAAAAIHR